MAKKYKFTQLIDILSYPKNYKMTLIDYHSSVVEYVCNFYRPSNLFMRSVVDTINMLSYIVCSDGYIPDSWDRQDPLKNLPDMDTDEVEEFLKPLHLFVRMEDIVWDIEPKDYDIPMKVVEKPKEDAVVSSSDKDSEGIKPDTNVESISASDEVILEDSKSVGLDLIPSTAEEPNDSLYRTKKEDLYIQAPVVPRIDTSSIYASGKSGADMLVIYNTLPRVPNKQRDISLTTDINLFTDDALMELYPDHFIPTRSSCMYEKIDGVEYDEVLGVIFPIAGFTTEQIRDNIIKYPHIYQLKKSIGGKLVTFYTTIEVDKELVKLADIWDERADTSLLPKTKEFFKEYSVRRYLLERDVEHITHQYPIAGGLDPFLTLFMTPDMYIKYGFKDVTDIAKMCVQSRVVFKRMRNPIMRRLSYV